MFIFSLGLNFECFRMIFALFCLNSKLGSLFFARISPAASFQIVDFFHGHLLAFFFSITIFLFMEHLLCAECFWDYFVMLQLHHKEA